MHKRGTESPSKEEKRGSERASESMGKKEAVGMKLEKYKQERLGYCSAKTKCGKGKALNTMKHKRETKCVRELTRKGEKKVRRAVGIRKSICRRVGAKESIVEREPL